MKRNHIALLFILANLFIVSCSKMDTLFNNGERITVYPEVEQPFHVVSLYNNVNVNLVQDDNPHLELTCPKNLIDRIDFNFKGDTLIIKNLNEYNWLRSYDYSIDLTVYYDSLREIHYASIGSLTCEDPIKGYRQQHIDTIGFVIDSTGIEIDTIGVEIDTNLRQSFTLRINEGSGDIDLNFNCDVLKTVFSNGTSKVTLRGSAGYGEHYLKSYGTIHAETLNSNIVQVLSESTNDIYVWACSQLIVKIFSIGNVYYKGQPWINPSIEGEGRLIKM